MSRTLPRSIRWLSLVIILLWITCGLTAGCSPPKQILPKVGPQAIPSIFPPERPEFKALTQAEYDTIPITAKGKILKSVTDWTAWADMADIAIQGYRSYIKSLFDEAKR